MKGVSEEGKAAFGQQQNTVQQKSVCFFVVGVFILNMTLYKIK